MKEDLQFVIVIFAPFILAVVCAFFMEKVYKSVKQENAISFVLNLIPVICIIVFGFNYKSFVGWIMGF